MGLVVCLSEKHKPTEETLIEDFLVYYMYSNVKYHSTYGLINQIK